MMALLYAMSIDQNVTVDVMAAHDEHPGFFSSDDIAYLKEHITLLLGSSMFWGAVTLGKCVYTREHDHRS